MPACGDHDKAPEAGAPDKDETEITPEMIEAGLKALYESGAVEIPVPSNDREAVRLIFESMLSRSPSFHRLGT